MSEPTKETETTAPMPPHLLALLASVEVARNQIRAARTIITTQLDTMDSALDAVLASAQAGNYSLFSMNNALRDRIARSNQPGGMPAVFGSLPGDQSNGQQGDPTGRLDAAP